MLVPEALALPFGRQPGIAAPSGVQLDEMLTPGAVKSG
jgi:hypothetical protein